MIAHGDDGCQLAAALDRRAREQAWQDAAAWAAILGGPDAPVDGDVADALAAIGEIRWRLDAVELALLQRATMIGPETEGRS